MVDNARTPVADDAVPWFFQPGAFGREATDEGVWLSAFFAVITALQVKANVPVEVVTDMALSAHKALAEAPASNTAREDVDAAVDAAAAVLGSVPQPV